MLLVFDAGQGSPICMLHPFLFMFFLSIHVYFGDS